MSAHNSDDDSYQNLAVQDSSDDEVEVTVASTRMLALELGSPHSSVDSNRGSTNSTAGTDMTPNYTTTMSISPDETSGGSGNTDSKIESIGNTPLDEPNLIEAILERRASADSKTPAGPRPDPEGALDPGTIPSTSAFTRVVSPIDVAADSKRGPGTSEAVVSGSQLECPKFPEERTLELKLSPGVPVSGAGQLPSASSGVAQVPVSDDGQLTSAPSSVAQVPVSDDGQLPSAPSGVAQVPVSDDGQLPSAPSRVAQVPVSDDGQLPSVPSRVAQVPVSDDDQLPSVPSDVPQGRSSAEGAEDSRAGSSDKVDDESCMSLSECSPDAESDALEADVSDASAIALERRRKAFRGRRPKPKSPPRLADVVADFFQPHPLVTYVDPDSRADTLDDAEALRLDSVSVRSSIPERGASVLFPEDEVSFPIPPDRSRRAISLPAAPAPKVPKVPHDPRRAISEAPDDSRLESEIPSLSASPDDVPLPSPLVSSSSSSSSRHVSDVDLNACGRLSSEEKSTPSDPVSEPSLESREVEAIMAASKDAKRDDLPSDGQSSDPSASELVSSDEAQLQGLQGWMSKGGYQGDQHVTSKGRAAVDESDSSMTRSSDEGQLEGCMSKGGYQEVTSKGRAAVDESDPSITKSSDERQLEGCVSKGGYPDDRQVTRKCRVAFEESESSITRSYEVAQLQALQGWVNQGRDQGEKPSGPPRVPNIPRETERVRPPVLSDSSSTKSIEEEAQFQALKGWMSHGRGARPSTIEDQPSGVIEDPNVPVASQPNVPERDVQVDVRSLTEVKEFDKWIARGAFAEDKWPTSGQPETPVAEESREAVEKGVQTEAGPELIGAPIEGAPPGLAPRFPESVKGQPEVSKTPKRKRQVRKEPERQPSDEQESTDSSDQPPNVEVSPEEGLATKKYCSEFSRPVVLARRLSRSHSTGSVKDEQKHRRNFREWQESSTKESPEREKMEEDEYCTSKKPKEDEEEEKDPNA